MQDMIEKHGEMAEDTAPAYFDYGCALLDFVVSNSDIFGKAVERAAERESERQVEEANMEEGEEEEEEEVQEEEVQETAETEPVDQEEEEEEQDELQLAWECLETARVILSKDVEKNAEFLAKVHYRLGDHSMETDNFHTAEEDYRKSLELFTKASKSISREAASVQYSLALSHMFREDAEGSLREFEKTIATFEALIENSSEKNETEELSSILNELKDRCKAINEAAEESQETSAEIKALVAGTMKDVLRAAEQVFDTPSENGDASEVNDLGTISSKRKEIKETETGPSAKISKIL